MNITQTIEAYIESLPEAKSSDMLTIHQLLLQLMPECKLWFLDGKNSAGKIIANPNIGYGSSLLTYADGSTKEFYQVGISANILGISVYLMGIEDKTFLARTYGQTIGKASVSGYCIKFKSLKDIHISVLQAALLSCIHTR